MIKLNVLQLMLFSGLVVFGQSNDKLKLESFQFYYGQERLHHGSQFVSDFGNTGNSEVLLSAFDSLTDYGDHQKWYNSSNYALEATFRKVDSKWRLNLAGSFINGEERFYSFQGGEDHIIDTTLAYIPVQGQSGYYETLLIDSIIQHEVNYRSISKSFMASGEIMRDFSKNKVTFSMGFGLGLGASITSKIQSSYDKNWDLWMVRYNEFDSYEPVWFAKIPQYNAAQGTFDHGGSVPLGEGVNRTTKGNTIWTVKPYLPGQLATKIAKSGFFSRVALVAKASVGCQLQMVVGDGLRPRFFYGVKAGLSYIL